MGDKLSQSLREAAFSGDVERIRQLVGQGVDVNARDPCGRTALHYAATEGQLVAAEVGSNFLRGRPAGTCCAGTVSTLCSDWSLPYCHTCAFKSPSCYATPLFLHPSAAFLHPPTHHPTHPPTRPLFCPPLLQELVRAGAALHAANHHGGTALHSAALRGHADVVEALTRAGAPVTASNEFGQTPLHCAAEHGHVGAIRALLRARAPVDAADHSGETPLHAASEWGREPAARALLAAGADPRRRLSRRWGGGASTARELAARHGHAALADVLRAAEEVRRGWGVWGVEPTLGVGVDAAVQCCGLWKSSACVQLCDTLQHAA